MRSPAQVRILSTVHCTLCNIVDRNASEQIIDAFSSHPHLMFVHPNQLLPCWSLSVYRGEIISSLQKKTTLSTSYYSVSRPSITLY